MPIRLNELDEMNKKKQQEEAAKNNKNYTYKTLDSGLRVRNDKISLFPSATSNNKKQEDNNKYNKLYEQQKKITNEWSKAYNKAQMNAFQKYKIGIFGDKVSDNTYKSEIKPENYLENKKRDEYIKQNQEKIANGEISIKPGTNTYNSPFNAQANKEKMELAKKETKPISDILKKEANTLKYAEYLKNVEDISKEDTTWWDKTGGNVTRALKDSVSFLNSDKYKYIDDDGNTIYLPSRADIKQQKVSEDYDTGVGKFLGDITYSGTKILSSLGIDALTIPTMGVPVGTMSYWTDMVSDGYRGAINQGYDEGSSLAYSLVNAGYEYAVSKFLGGATGKLTSGSEKALDNAIGNASNRFLSKLTNNPELSATISRYIGTMGSEASEEFVQEYLDNISRILILEKGNLDLQSVLNNEEIFEDAMYSAAVGAGTAGFVEGANKSDVDSNVKMFSTFKEQLEERIKNTTDTETKKKYQDMIDNINTYLDKPFTIDPSSLDETVEEINNLPEEQNTPNSSENTQNGINIPTNENVSENGLNVPINENTNIEENTDINLPTNEDVDPTENLIKYQEKIIQQQETRKQELQQEETNKRLENIEKQLGELENSSFIIDKNAKRYDDLTKTNNIEYFKKDNGDVRVNLLDSNNNLVNQFDLYSKREAISQLGEKIGSQIYENANPDNQIYRVGNDINNLGTETDYFMTHRPTESGITADNLLKEGTDFGLPKDVYEHPEYYSGTYGNSLNETMEVLNAIRNNPNADIIIYRATTGDKFNPGDWVTLSKSYAEMHNQDNLDGKGKVIEMKVKPTDIQFAGDDLNEWGYFPKQPNIPTTNKGNIPINEELYKKYSNVEEIFNGERNNYNGEVKISNNIPELSDIDFSNITPKDSSHFKDIAIEIFHKYNSNTIFTNNNNKIEVSNDGIKKSIDTIFKSKEQLNLLKEHLQVFSDLGDIIEHATLVNQDSEIKGRESINLWSYYFDGLNINGKNYNLEFDVRSMENGKNQYRVQRLELKGTKKANRSTGVASNNTRNLPALEQSASINNNNTTSQKSQISLPTKQESKVSMPMAKTDDVIKISNDIAKQINSTGGFDMKQRSWVTTSTESDVLKDKIYIDDLEKSAINYVVQSNKKSLDSANRHLDTYGYEKSLDYVKNLMQSDKLPSASDVALMQRMIQEATKKGDYEAAQELIMDTAIVGTDLGQATQALSMIQRLTPEGQLKMYTKLVQRAKARGEKSFQNVEITPEMVQNILEAYNKDGTYDQNDLNARVEKFKQDIADQMKSTAMEKIDAWRYLAMLGNPKTHIRNIVSNIAMKGTIKVKNAMARTLETVLPVKERTKTWKQASQEVKNFSKETAENMKGIITGENKYNEKSAIESKKQTFKNKILEKLSNFNGNALEGEDWFFSKRAFQSTLQEYLTANGINTLEDIKNNPELVEKAKMYAVEQAEIATFRQYSQLAASINRFEKKNKLGKFALEALMPFKKTPINVAKAGVNYSPLGLIKSISYDAYQLKKGNINASQFIDKISQGLTGTSLTLLGYALAKAGFISGSGDDDKEGKYDSQLGNTGYSVNIGGNSYSISWLSPVAMPLLVGANAYEQLEEDKDWDMNVVSDTLAKTLDPLNEMSFMQGLTNALQSYGGGTDKIKGALESTGQNYVGQFFPTLFSQIAATTDDKKRSTKASNDSKYKFGEQTIRSIMYKVPGLRQQLEVATDIWGNEKEQSDNIIERAFENFIAPYSKTKQIETDLDKEIKRVYDETGETGVIPSIPYAYVKYKDETYKMSANEYTKYKKTYGQTAYNTLNKLVNSSDYKQATDEDKAKMLEDAYDYARGKANQEYFDSNDVDYENKLLNKLDTLNDRYGISANTYFANKEEYDYAYQYPDNYSVIKQIAPYSKYTEYKERIADIKDNTTNDKQETIKYINGLSMSVPQKAMFIKQYYKSFKQYDKEIVNYINSQNLTVKEKQQVLKKLGFTIKDGRVYY